MSASAQTSTDLVHAVLSADGDAIDDQLAGEVSFNSPIRAYSDRRDIVHLLALLGTLLPSAQVERIWRAPRGAATVISADVDGNRLDGIIEELHDEDGRVSDVTLMLRPHSAMMAAIKHMAAALEASPLPSQRPLR